MAEEGIIPVQFTHSVKISDTAKGIRIDVHVWANDMETAVLRAFNTYDFAKETAEIRGIPLAPVEITTK